MRCGPVRALAFLRAGSGRGPRGRCLGCVPQAVADGWGPIDRMDFAPRLCDWRWRSRTAPEPSRRLVRCGDEAIRWSGDNAPDRRTRSRHPGTRPVLPFDFDAVAEQVIWLTRRQQLATTYAAWIDRQKPEDRESLQRRRVQVAADAADAVRAGVIAVDLRILHLTRCVK